MRRDVRSHLHPPGPATLILRRPRGSGGRPVPWVTRSLLAALLVLAAALFGCESDEGTAGADDREVGSTPSRPAAEEQGVVYIFARSPTSILPPLAVTPDDVAIVDQVFEPLTRLDAALELRPAAAVSWDVSEDGTVHTFTLRRDATFHDGSAVTAASFVRAWERVADRTVDEPSPAHHLLDLVVGIDDARDGDSLAGAVAVDERTLEVTLREPYADLPALLSHPALAPTPLAADLVSDFDRMPIGNGPLRMAEPWHPGQVIRLEPNVDHPRAPGGVRQVVFRLYDGDEAEVTAYEDLRTGRLDLAPVPAAMIDEAREDFGTATGRRIGPGLIDGPSMTTVFIAFNVEMEPYDDPDLRRAIASVVDRGSVGPDVDGSWIPARSIVPPAAVAGYEPPACGYCTFDPELAHGLLGGADDANDDEDPEAEAGAEGEEGDDDGSDADLELEITYPDDPRYELIATELAEALADLDRGISLELRPLVQDEWLEAVRGGEAGMFLSGWLAEYPSAGAYLDHLFHPERIGTDNLTRLSQDEVTELLDEARAATDPRERAARHREVEAIVLDEMPVIPLHHYRHLKVASERLAGAMIDPAGRVYLDWLAPVGAGSSGR